MIGTVTAVLKHLKAALAQILDAPAMLAFCREAGSQWRPRLLDPVTTVHLCILHILHGHTAWSHLPPGAGQRLTASALCQARTRFPLVVWQPVLRRTTASVDQTTQDEGRWRGHRPCLGDGSSCSRSETPELPEHCGQPGGQRPGCGGPVAHLLAWFHAGTGFLLDVIADPLHPHDLARVTARHPTLQSGDVRVGDRAFCSLAHLALLRQQGLHARFRVPQKPMVDCTPSRPHTVAQAPRVQQGVPRSRWLRQRGGTDQRVEWVKPRRPPVHPPAWMPPALSASFPATLCVRARRYRVAQAGLRTQTVTLVTTLLEVEAYPADAVADLDGRRWHVETTLRHLTQTMGLDVLHGQRLAGVMQARTVFAWVDNLVCVVMREAAKRQGGPSNASAASMPCDGSAPRARVSPCPRWWSIPTDRTASSPVPSNADPHRTRSS